MGESTWGPSLYQSLNMAHICPIPSSVAGLQAVIHLHTSPVQTLVELTPCHLHMDIYQASHM